MMRFVLIFTTPVVLLYVPISRRSWVFIFGEQELLKINNLTINVNEKDDRNGKKSQWLR